MRNVIGLNSTVIVHALVYVTFISHMISTQIKLKTHNGIMLHAYPLRIGASYQYLDVK